MFFLMRSVYGLQYGTDWEGARTYSDELPRNRPTDRSGPDRQTERQGNKAKWVTGLKQR